MKNQKNIIILLLTTILCVLVTCILFYVDKINYAIIATILSFISLISLLLYMKSSKSFATFYESSLNKKIKSYSAVMVKSEELPVIEDKNIIFLSDFDGLIDAQNAIKKPIFYLKEIETCVFILIDNKEAMVYIYRQDYNYETKLKRTISKNKRDIDHSILEDLEKTAIIKLDNTKKYKVSPIRNTNQKKKKKDKKEAKR